MCKCVYTVHCTLHTCDCYTLSCLMFFKCTVLTSNWCFLLHFCRISGRTILYFPVPRIYSQFQCRQWTAISVQTMDGHFSTDNGQPFQCRQYTANSSADNGRPSPVQTMDGKSSADNGRLYFKQHGK